MKKVLSYLAAFSTLCVVAACNPSQPSSSSVTPTTSSVTPTTSSAPTSSSVEELKETTVYIVGDSTLAAFNDTTYYYPRYGYGTQLSSYLDSKAKVVNLAISGRSSKNFLGEANYQTLKDNLKEGDFLIIGFGHNDEKNDDESRFTDASLPTDDPNSFKYSLNENYVKLAQEKGATPILCSPIVRASSKNDYSGSNGHVTTDGNYGQAVVDLANEVGVPFVDMTTITKDYYTQIGYDAAIYLHAMTAGKLDTDGTTVIADIASVDTTHLNVYGAKMVAYLFAKDISSKTSGLEHYVNQDVLVEPSKSETLVSNPSYVYSDYSAPNLEAYTPVEQFTTISDGWYGTAFGDLGGNPESTSNGYVAKETAKGTFLVGQTASSNKGKFSSTTEGIAFAFRQVSVSKNFTLTAKAKVITAGATNQAGFGLMIRDNCFLPSNNKALLGTHISAGFLAESGEKTTVIFARESDSALSKSSNKVTGWYATDSEAILTIARLGQKVTVTVVYNGQTYVEEYLDFPLTVDDGQFMYIGMFANRGTTVEFTEVKFEITGDAIEA